MIEGEGLATHAPLSGGGSLYTGYAVQSTSNIRNKNNQVTLLKQEKIGIMFNWGISTIYYLSQKTLFTRTKSQRKIKGCLWLTRNDLAINLLVLVESVKKWK